MFNLVFASAFALFVLSPCVMVLLPQAHKAESQDFVL